MIHLRIAVRGPHCQSLGRVQCPDVSIKIFSVVWETKRCLSVVRLQLGHQYLTSDDFVHCSHPSTVHRRVHY